jgi:hypothetical protein
MSNWANWYKALLVVWAIIALPGTIIGIGFSGGDLELPYGFVGTVLWLLLVLFILSPAFLWPWRKSAARNSG